MTPARLQSFLAIVDTGSARAAAARLQRDRVGGVGVAGRPAAGGGRDPLRTPWTGPAAHRVRRRLRVVRTPDPRAARRERRRGPQRGGARGRDGCGSGPSPPPASTSSRACSRTSWLPTPTSTITLDVGVRDHILHRLADHHLDVVVGGRPLPGRGMVSRATRENSLVVVAAPDLRRRAVQGDLAAARTRVGDPRHHGRPPRVARHRPADPRPWGRTAPSSPPPCWGSASAWCPRTRWRGTSPKASSCSVTSRGPPCPARGTCSPPPTPRPPPRCSWTTRDGVPTN